MGGPWGQPEGTRLPAGLPVVPWGRLRVAAKPRETSPGDGGQWDLPPPLGPGDSSDPTRAWHREAAGLAYFAGRRSSRGQLLLSHHGLWGGNGVRD